MLLSFVLSGTYFSGILIERQFLLFTEMHLNISSVKWRLSCPGRDELNYYHFKDQDLSGRLCSHNARKPVRTGSPIIEPIGQGIRYTACTCPGGHYVNIMSTNPNRPVCIIWYRQLCLFNIKICVFKKRIWSLTWERYRALLRLRRHVVSSTGKVVTCRYDTWLDVGGITNLSETNRRNL